MPRARASAETRLDAAARRKEAEESAVYVEDLTDAYLFCRTFGHPWYEYLSDDRPVSRRRRNPEYIELHCERCGMVRVDAIGPIGELESRDYTPPKGYKVAGKPGAAEYRIEVLQRRRRNL